ncbi:caffeoylshikimate esterase [Asparagus officinalis]|uniref:caffeoylshikimate esterase n=1 Tax=Asparagus officinalis TaxID=4686 RepID=UPI00098E8663|nr:caffeoylshikimate esterase [Asparagus officinalis]
MGARDLFYRQHLDREEKKIGPSPSSGQAHQVKPKYFWGNDPESEEAYYASQNIRSTSSFFTSGSLSLFTRCWLPPESRPQRGLVLMIHGYGNDISWTFQSTPIFLAQNGYACYALDLPGHGRSQGLLKAFVPDLNAAIDHCIAYFNSVINLNYQQQQQQHLKCFLYGESMGGAICLLIHLLRRVEFSGAVLAAPMCKISDRIRPRWPIPSILSLLGRFMPTLPIVPTANLVEKSVKVEEKRAIASANPLSYLGKPRLGTVLELLRATDDLSSRLSDVTIPFLVLHGSADVVTDPEVSRDLYEKAKSEDKTVKIYEGMMHSLLFGETDSNVAMVRADILEWLNHRTNPN